MKLGSFSKSAKVLPVETPGPVDCGVGKFMTDSSACNEVTRKKISKKKTISTIAVMSMRSSGCGRCGGMRGGSSAAADRPATLRGLATRGGGTGLMGGAIIGG